MNVKTAKESRQVSGHVREPSEPSTATGSFGHTQLTSLGGTEVDIDGVENRSIQKDAKTALNKSYDYIFQIYFTCHMSN